MSETNNFSYGMELELGDIDRSVDIPEHLGSWEGVKDGNYYMGAECDVVNSIPPYRGVCTDPLARTCTVGGEINVVPTTTIGGQFEQIIDIIELFEDVSISHMSHFHIHVHIPGLKDDLKLLKRFTLYCLANQDALIKTVYLQNIHTIPDSISNKSIEYLWSDGGRYISEYVYNNIHECSTVDELLNLFDMKGYYKFKGDIRNTSSIRSAINLSNLIKGETVEFRCFRPTLDLYELVSQLDFVEQFCQEAIKPMRLSVGEILATKNYRFAELQYDHINQIGWENTKHSKERGDGIKYSQTQFKKPIDREDSSIFTEIQSYL